MPRRSCARPLTAALLFACLLGVAAIPRAAPGSQKEDLQSVLERAHEKFREVDEGRNADYIAALSEVPAELFGLAIMTRDGRLYSVGDTTYEFSIQSVSKPFTAALVMAQSGPETLRRKIGVEPTGLAFNSKLALELHEERSANPMVNAGAIAAVSLVDADTETARREAVLRNLSAFAGRDLQMLDAVYDSEYETAWSNRAIANLLYSYGRLYSDPEEALRVYTAQCSVGVDVRDLAAMGATLANGGLQPLTGRRLMASGDVPELLAIMATAGFYDQSGEWMYSTGLPAKTGVGGGIVAVVPGRFAIAGFSPPLNEAGNSVRALRAIRYIAAELGLGLFGPNAGE